MRRRLREIDRRVGLLEALREAGIRRATGLRNLLVHGYLDVDPERIWGHLDRLGDLRAFAAAIEAHLGRQD